MTQNDLDELEKAYFRGILKVREGDTWVEYQSMKDMRIAIQDAKITLQGGKPSGVRIVRVNTGY
jgi:hypothetical protein